MKVKYAGILKVYDDIRTRPIQNIKDLDKKIKIDTSPQYTCERCGGVVVRSRCLNCGKGYCIDTVENLTRYEV